MDSTASDWRRMTEKRNAEAKFASPEDNTGIGYYDNDGEQLSPEAFRERVSEDAARIEAEETAKEGGPS